VFLSSTQSSPCGTGYCFEIVELVAMTSRQLSEAELKKLRKGNEVVITSEYSVLRMGFP